MESPVAPDTQAADLCQLRDHVRALYEMCKATDAVFRKSQQYLEDRLAIETEFRHRAETKLALLEDQLRFVQENARSLDKPREATEGPQAVGMSEYLALASSYRAACTLLTETSSKCADLDLEIAKQRRHRKELEAKLWKAERAAAFRQTLSASAVVAPPLISAEGSKSDRGGILAVPSLEVLAAIRTDIVALEKTLTELPSLRPSSA